MVPAKFLQRPFTKNQKQFLPFILLRVGRGAAISLSVFYFCLRIKKAKHLGP